MIEQLGHKAIYVRSVNELDQCAKLIIPGGESTTFLYLIDKLNLRESIKTFGRKKGIMGTCAGLITLGKEVDQFSYAPLKMIDIRVHRNAYGRQINSFVDVVNVNIPPQSFEFEGVFIRAPKIEVLNRKSVQVLAFHNQEVVMARNRNILVATFHPELSGDQRIHQYFIEQVGSD